MRQEASSPLFIPADQLEGLVQRIFLGLGSTGREAELVARHLVEANLRGHDSHGVGVLPGYVRNAQAGELVVNRALEIALDLGSLLLCDGHLGAGQVMAHDAMEVGIGRARENGSCIVLLRNSHHIGRIGHWAEQCAEAGVVSVHFVNVVSDPAVAPFGGTAARLGTNPFAVGVPRHGAPPIIVDFATSRWAVGKVRVAMKTGTSVPPGTLLDANGQPTDDPAALFTHPPGALLTFGDHKGWGLSLACEVLAGALTGGKTQSGPRTRPAVVNSMFSVLVSADAIGTAGRFAAQVDAVVQWVQSETRASKPAVYLPGEPELETRVRRLRDGVPIDPATWQEIQAAAELANIREAP
jgi:uncharacterized oxidoreductase